MARTRTRAQSGGLSCQPRSLQICCVTRGVVGYDQPMVGRVSLSRIGQPGCGSQLGGPRKTPEILMPWLARL